VVAQQYLRNHPDAESIAGVGMYMSVDFVDEMCGGAAEYERFGRKDLRVLGFRSADAQWPLTSA